MPLKAVVHTKAELDQLAEPVRALYAEREGKWYLDVEGMVSKAEHDEVRTKLGEFRDNNRVMFDELKELRPIGEALKKKNVNDVSAFLTEHDTLKTTVEELKSRGVKGTDDLQKLIDGAMKPVLERLDATETARKKAQEAVDEATFERLVTTDAQKAGARPTALRFIITEARKQFDLKDGKLVAKPGTKHPEDPLKDLTPDVWLTQLSKQDDYLFGDSTGGGAQNSGGRNGGRPDAKQLINPSPEEMGMHMNDIAAGKVVVVRTP